jgi:hypothetical protein
VVYELMIVLTPDPYPELITGSITGGTNPSVRLNAIHRNTLWADSVSDSWQ